MERICKECGLLFNTKSSRALYCDRVHIRTCNVCGVSFEVSKDKLSTPNSTKYCSTKCSNIAKGSSYLNRHSMLATCKVCGESFMSTGGRIICNKHTSLICKHCGKEFEASREDILSGKQTCSKECRYALANSTYTKNFGKGTEGFLDMQKRHAASTYAHFGVNNPMQCKEVSSKAIASKKEKYGEDLAEITKKIQDTTEARYGYRFLMQNPEFKEAAKSTCTQRYGVDNYAKSSEFLQQVITDPTKYEICKEFRDDPAAFLKKYFPVAKPSLQELSDICGIADSSVGWILNEHGIVDGVRYVYSRMEDEIFAFLTSILPNNSCILRNTHRVITPYELDIYLPDYNFAVECNPTITHNSSFPGFGKDDSPKSISYHKMKTDMCEAKGIFLFHVFGYEWSHRKDIIKSMIANVLRTNSEKVYARTCSIKEVSDADSIEFLSKNHRQGGAHSKIRLGLFDSNDRLVSLMTFSSMRKTIGTGKDDTSNCYELVRFCNVKGTSVVGGASKLFKYFLRIYNPKEIRSFSDRAHTRGKLYETLGFVNEHISDPGYVWVDLKTDKAYSRNNAQKKNIKAFLKDDTIDLTMTEVEIMKSHKFAQVFDSGVILWIWRKEE